MASACVVLGGQVKIVARNSSNQARLLLLRLQAAVLLEAANLMVEVDCRALWAWAQQEAAQAQIKLAAMVAHLTAVPVQMQTWQAHAQVTMRWEAARHWSSVRPRVARSAVMVASVLVMESATQPLPNVNARALSSARYARDSIVLDSTKTTERNALDMAFVRWVSVSVLLAGAWQQACPLSQRGRHKLACKKYVLLVVACTGDAWMVLAFASRAGKAPIAKILNAPMTVLAMVNAHSNHPTALDNAHATLAGVELGASVSPCTPSLRHVRMIAQEMVCAWMASAHAMLA